MAACHALFSLEKGVNFMYRQYKTSKKNRTNYIYYTVDGTKIIIAPGEDGVNTMDIELLHTMDDEEVDEQRRYNYRIIANLDEYHDGEGEEADDRNQYLTDYSYNPERVYLEKERQTEHLSYLRKTYRGYGALNWKQKELFKKNM